MNFWAPRISNLCEAMLNISSNLNLCNVTVHVIDLVLRLGTTRKCGDSVKRVVGEQVVNMQSVCCLELCSVTYIHIYKQWRTLVCLIMGLFH